MQTIRVAAVSMNGFLGESERVLQAIDAWSAKAAAAGAELVLFPELVIHGHCTPNTWELAEPVPDGPSVARLVQVARRLTHYDWGEKELASATIRIAREGRMEEAIDLADEVRSDEQRGEAHLLLVGLLLDEGRHAEGRSVLAQAFRRPAAAQ